ncbi:FecR domain-containing protein [Parapedobacter indicus]|uniref:FecR family protein n=1 Tax=Parapedobacter indicus TaxID=1477437 RepID=A0A1I3M6I1_9SPHI|nr:FecR domain-containing protein [Parapedobacter indicus]PPL01262.1 FecR family protein [Parapedobacter indicus]SFI92659.1 FecR family protein [Parapedobacter indicus]
MDDILLTKYLLNETNEAESASVRAWIAAHPDHARRYEHLQRIWKTSKSLGSQLTVDEEEAWHRFVQRRDSGATSRKGGNVRWINGLRYAAALILLPLTVWALYTFWNSRYGDSTPIVYETKEATHTDTLTDGSIITLNSFATLRYAQETRTHRRLATLDEGEVFFKVKSDPDRPFIVQSGEVTVTVLGTSFHVKRNGDQTEVIVESGHVKVTGPKREVELSLGGKLLINTTTHQFEVGKVTDQLHNYYVDNQFVAVNTPLWRLAEVLSQAYHTDIRIENPEIRNLPITTTFRRDDLDRILEVIGVTLRIEVKREGDKILLR